MEIEELFVILFILSLVLTFFGFLSTQNLITIIVILVIIYVVFHLIFQILYNYLDQSDPATKLTKVASGNVCPNCGSSIARSGIFCSSCGFHIQTT